MQYKYKIKRGNGMKSVAQRLNEEKNKLKLTNVQIANASDVPLSTVTKILNGETKDPSANALRSIAKTLGLTLDELYGDNAQSDDSASKIFRIILEEKNNELAKEQKYVRALFIVVVALVGVLVGMTLLDALNGRVGWIRYGDMAATFANKITTLF